MSGRLRLLQAALVLSLAVACGPGPAPPPPAPQPPVIATAAVDRAVATTGDLITYTVTVDHDRDYQIELPEPGAEIAGFRIVDAGREDPRTIGDRIVVDRWYRLRADLVGSYVLPPVTVSYWPAAIPAGDGDAAAGSADGNTVPDTATVVAPEVFVEIESVLAAAGDATDIRDIKPLQPPRRRLTLWLWIAGIASVLAVATAVFVHVARRRRQAESRPAAPPHEVAFEILRQLRETDFDDPLAVRRFHFAISETLRGYVEGRFGLNATDLTTEEIAPRLERMPDLTEDPRDRLVRFLAATDRVKFADHKPTLAEIEQTYERALSFVEMTQPIRPEEEAAAS